MSEKPETVADVLAEMRAVFQPNGFHVTGLRAAKWAIRIEAALERDRKALLEVAGDMELSAASGSNNHRAQLEHDAARIREIVG